MNNKKIGFSVYPEIYSSDFIEKYIDENIKLGYKEIFTTIQLGELSFDGFEENIEINQYKKIFDLAKDNKIILSVDINDKSLKKIDATPSNLKPLNDLNISCIRLDGGFTDEEVVSLTKNQYNIIIEENASNVKTITKRIKLIIEKGNIKNFRCSFNFFPLVNTGHSYEYIEQSINKIKELSSEVVIGAFISDNDAKNDLCNLNQGICTIEEQRGKESYISMLEMFALDVDFVMFGEGSITKNALTKCSEIYNNGEINHHLEMSYLDNIPENVRKEISSKIDGDREDSSKGSVRLTELRGIEIDPINNDEELKYLDVMIQNNLSGSRYKGEVKIALEKFGALDHVSKIGAINKEYKVLTEIYKTKQTKFRLNEGKRNV